MLYTVKFMSGDIKEYDVEENNTFELKERIATDCKIEMNRVNLIINDDESDDFPIQYFVFIEESKDYPFNCWENYFNAFKVSLQGGTYNFPKYEEYSNENGIKGDIEIMMELLSTEDPQEGLDGLINACIDGHRYSYEIIKDLKPVVDCMVERGAVININRIMTPQYDERKYFEDEMIENVAKANLLHLLFDYDGVKEKVNSYVEWDAVEPLYWEEMIGGRNYYELSERYNYKDAYYMAMKHEFNHINKEEDEDHEDW